jgi:predicted XRE-type DNA-binding protein
MKNHVSSSGQGKKRKQEAEEPVTPGSGNVFADLGIPNAEQYLAKAELARRICALIAARKLTRAKAAALLGLSPSQLLDLMRGLFDDFSSDRLFQFLNVLGQDVEIVIKPHGRQDSQASTRVIAR